MSSRHDALLRLMAKPEADAYSMEEIRRVLQLQANEEVMVVEVEPRARDTWLGEYVQVCLEEAEAWEAAADAGWGAPDIVTAAPSDLADVLRARSRQHRRRRHHERTTDAITMGSALGRTGMGVSPPVDTGKIVVDRYLTIMAESLGAASLAVLELRLAAAVSWAAAKHDPDKGPFETFADAVARIAVRRFIGQMPEQLLRFERDDESARLAAINDERHVAAYLGYVRDDMTAWIAWRRRVPIDLVQCDEYLQDLVGAVLVRVLELLRQGAPAWRPYARPCRPAPWQVRDEVIGRLRRRQRMWLVENPTDVIHAYLPRPDEVRHQRDVEHAHREPAYEILRPHLSPRMAAYLDAFVIELQLNGRQWGLQERVARRMGRGKSRVSEAVAKIRKVAKRLGLEARFADLWSLGQIGHHVPGVGSVGSGGGPRLRSH